MILWIWTNKHNTSYVLYPNQISTVSFLRSYQSWLSVTKTQDQPETPHSLHHVAAAGPGEEVQTEAVPVHRREGRVFILLNPDRDPGQNLVSKPAGQSQEAPGGWAGEAQDGLWRQDGGGGGGGCCGSTASWLHITPVFKCHVDVRTVLLCLPSPPQIHAAHLTARTLCCPSGLRHVPPILKTKQNKQTTEISLTVIDCILDTTDVWQTFRETKQCS